MDVERIVAMIRARTPSLMAVYGFGSRVSGDAGPDSDLDLAVLVEGYADPLRLFELAGDLSDVAGCPVDLLDLRAASTVMQYEVITTGRRWWAGDARPALFEAAVLSEKTALDEARAGLLEDIRQRGRCMADDVLLNKAAIIERCVQRAREEYAADKTGFATNFTRQDAAVLNVQRACEATLDMGQHLIRRERLGVPQGARDVFALLEAGGWLDGGLAASMKRMVGFRNIAVHQYQALQLPILVDVIEHRLDDFLAFSKAVLLRDAGLRPA